MKWNLFIVLIASSLRHRPRVTPFQGEIRQRPCKKLIGTGIYGPGVQGQLKRPIRIELWMISLIKSNTHSNDVVKNFMAIENLKNFNFDFRFFHDGWTVKSLLNTDCNCLKSKFEFEWRTDWSISSFGRVRNQLENLLV